MKTRITLRYKHWSYNTKSGSALNQLCHLGLYNFSIMWAKFLDHKIWELNAIVSLVLSSNQIFDSLKVFLILPGKGKQCILFNFRFSTEYVIICFFKKLKYNHLQKYAQIIIRLYTHTQIAQATQIKKQNITSTEKSFLITHFHITPTIVSTVLEPDRNEIQIFLLYIMVCDSSMLPFLSSG